MNAFLQELKIAIYSLRRRTGFVATVVLTLGITLGALVTFFNLNHVLLLKPLPYPEHERLQLTQHVMIDSNGEATHNSPLVPGLLHTYKNQQSFELMTILSTGSEFLTSHHEQPRLAVTFTTPEYFELLATPMTIGRAFTQTEGLGQNNPVVILSYQSWQKWFQGDPQVLGRKITLRNTSFTIVGVAAQDFMEPEILGELSDVWAPWDFNGMDESLLKSWNNGQGNIAGFGRLNATTDEREAQAQLSNSLADAYQNFLSGIENRAELSGNIVLRFQSLKSRLLGDSHLQALLLMGSVFALLIIASANVINLFYSRAAEKQRTFAIQAALGARKRHLFTAMFAESLILTIASSLLGLVIAMWGIDLVKSLGQGQFNRLHELGLDMWAILFSLFVSIVLAAVFSLLSSSVVNYDNLKEQLQSSGKGSGLQISKQTRNLLVVSQIFLASLLLIGASMVLGQAYSVMNKSLGYDKTVMHSFSLDERVGLIEADEIARRNQMISDITTRINQLPQVAAIAPSFNTAIGYNMTMGAMDRDNNKRGSFPTNFVSSEYFQTLQIQVVEGRMFSEQEVRDNAPVAVLSRSAAEQVSQGESVVGLKLTIGGGPLRTIVGVVEDVFDPVRTDEAQYHDAYLPHAPWNIHFIMRLQPGAELERQQLVTLIRDIDPGLRLANYRSFTERHDSVMLQDRITAGVAAGLSTLALLLAGTGIFGVLSYSSHMRRYELGVRMALGAKTRQISAMVIKDNMKPIGIGLALSLIVAAASYVVGQQYFGWFDGYSVSPLAITVPVILLTALLASFLPVRNVIRKDPIKALRND
ncbi:ABC transporter permease [Alteromonas facilis]|uniref:ABC transporter permease n=1 Tax=Alteromonas facilis TaxID=2048004 RepID=UPI000C2935BD|nr:ABC transporter permease [Alteromonas facilis]